MCFGFLLFYVGFGKNHAKTSDLHSSRWLWIVTTKEWKKLSKLMHARRMRQWKRMSGCRYNSRTEIVLFFCRCKKNKTLEGSCMHSFTNNTVPCATNEVLVPEEIEFLVRGHREFKRFLFFFMLSFHFFVLRFAMWLPLLFQSGCSQTLWFLYSFFFHFHM